MACPQLSVYFSCQLAGFLAAEMHTARDLGSLHRPADVYHGHLTSTSDDEDMTPIFFSIHPFVSGPSQFKRYVMV
jgi:hypothetical protein